MTGQKQRFFIALLPPEDVQQVANEIKQHFDQVYHSRAALKSPPHITLQPPFLWDVQDLPRLESALTEFSLHQSPIPMNLENFGAFPPRVIYINVLKTTELLTLQTQLGAFLSEQLNIVDIKATTRPFSPHLTVAFRDLSKQNFRKAWPLFAEQKLEYNFIVNQLTLLIHNGKRWEIKNNYYFQNKC